MPEEKSHWMQGWDWFTNKMELQLTMPVQLHSFLTPTSLISELTLQSQLRGLLDPPTFLPYIIFFCVFFYKDELNKTRYPSISRGNDRQSRIYSKKLFITPWHVQQHRAWANELTHALIYVDGRIFEHTSWDILLYYRLLSYVK